MHPVRQAQPVFQCQWRQPAFPFAQGGAGGALWHQEDAVAGQGMGFDQGQHFGQVTRFGHHEFEPGPSVGGPGRQPFGDLGQVGRIAGMGQLGADVVLADQRIERRVERLVNPNLSDGLPAFLTADGGLNSGFMIPQYVAASLVSENKVLCHPASVDSIPSSLGQEDHVSMGATSARSASRAGSIDPAGCGTDGSSNARTT